MDPAVCLGNILLFQHDEGLRGKRNPSVGIEGRSADGEQCFALQPFDWHLLGVSPWIDGDDDAFIPAGSAESECSALAVEHVETGVRMQCRFVCTQRKYRPNGMP